MTGTNQFLNFASAATNILSQTDYAALSDLTAGSSSGIVSSPKWNKMFRQALAISNLIGSFIAKEGYNANDDGNAANLLTAFENALAAYQQSLGRVKLSSNTSFYVNGSTGDDSTGDGTSSYPWATIQKAVNYVADSVDMAGYTATISVADGTYSAGAWVDSTFVGGGTVLISGNTTNPSNCIVSTSTTMAHCFVAKNGAAFQLQGFKTITTGGSSNHVLSESGSAISIVGNMNFGAASGSSSGHLVSRGGVINVLSSYTVSGSSSNHYDADGSGSYVRNSDNLGNPTSPITVTVTGTPAIGSFAFADQCGSVQIIGATFSGSSTGYRYLAYMNGTINTAGGGASYFPGGTAGVTTTGGQYA